MVPSVPHIDDTGTRRLFRLLIGVFFIGGFLTSVVSLVVPRFKLTLGLDYSQALLAQFAFHASYLLFAVPITAMLVRRGYTQSIAIGLGIMAVACLAFAAAEHARDFPLILAALLLLSLGITVLQIAANAVVTVAGTTGGSAARLTLLQGFNSVGTVLGPLLTAQLLLSSPAGSAATGRLPFSAGSALSAAGAALPFVASAIGLAALAILFIRQTDFVSNTSVSPTISRTMTDGTWHRCLAALRDRRLGFGVVAMFAYVGAEVTIGTLLANFLMARDILGARPSHAGMLVSLYWGGAMAGRFIGAALLRRVAVARLLIIAGCGAAALTLLAPLAAGTAGAAALLAVGLCNSIMYPAIYAMALPTAQAVIPTGSMLLCMAVVGGAVVPVVTGIAADRAGLGPALVLPALCYLGIVAYARWYRPRPPAEA